MKKSKCCNARMIDGDIQCENCGSNGEINKKMKNTEDITIGKVLDSFEASEDSEIILKQYYLKDTYFILERDTSSDSYTILDRTSNKEDAEQMMSQLRKEYKK